MVDRALSFRGPKVLTALVIFLLALKWRRLKLRRSSTDFGFESERYTARTMSSRVQRRRRMGADSAIARDTTALYSSSRQQHVRDLRPGTTKFFEAGGAERTTTAQTRCYSTSSYSPDAKHKYVHSDHSETTAETTCSSGGGAVCSDDSRTTADSTTSCSSSHKSNVIALQLQMQALHTSCPNPYFLDSADRLINLPDDLIKEVFGRLSVKEIVRMGCLNRSWRSEMRRFITDEQFNYS